jgi:ABC-type amino acid transport substrate-binding protein
MRRFRFPATRRQQIALVLLGLVVLLAFGRPALRWVWRLIVPLPAQPMLPYGVLRVGIDASYPPFGVAAGDGTLSGLDVDLARAVAEAMGVELRFINMGYDGLYDSLRADQADALFSALRVDPLRTNDARYTSSYFDAGQVLVRAPDTGIDEMADLDGLILAVEFGAEGDLEARRWQRRLHSLAIIPHESAAQALDTVQAGNANAALVDAISARLWLREHAGSPLGMAPQYVTGDPYAVAVQPGNPRLWQAIEAALGALRNSGALDEIINRWL